MNDDSTNTTVNDRRNKQVLKVNLFRHRQIHEICTWSDNSLRMEPTSCEFDFNTPYRPYIRHNRLL